MSYTVECLEKFKSLPKDQREAFGNIEVVKKVIEFENKHEIKVDFLLILIAIGEIDPEDVRTYLIKKFEITDERARETESDLIDTILMPIFDSFEDKEEKPIDIESEYKNVIKILEDSLISKLKDSNKNLDLLNKNIIYTLGQKEQYKNELVKILLNNEEKLTGKKITIDEKAYPPTVSNWITDFIKIHGSGPFSNLKLFKHMTESKNTRTLDNSEQAMVKKVIMLYRNLAFFPESFAGIPFDSWEIFPLKREGGDLIKARRVSGPPRTEEEKSIEELRSAEEQYEEGGIERLAIEEEIDKKTQIEGLEIEAKKYKEGSLEYKALLEEIEKLKRN